VTVQTLDISLHISCLCHNWAALVCRDWTNVLAFCQFKCIALYITTLQSTICLECRYWSLFILCQHSATTASIHFNCPLRTGKKQRLSTGNRVSNLLFHRSGTNRSITSLV